MHIVLSQTSGLPMYEQISEQIRNAMYSGALKAGDALPSLRHLARDLQVSMITTTRAYNDLTAEGLIVNQPGRGSFVLPLDEELVRSRMRSRLAQEARALAHTAHLAGITEIEALRVLSDAYRNQESEEESDDHNA